MELNPENVTAKEMKAFKEACEKAGITGMEMKVVEKRKDAAAILWDLYEIDVNPVNLNEGAEGSID